MEKELDINRNLINSQFNSYRLILNPNFLNNSVSFREEFGPLQTLKLGQNDFSYLHCSMACNINNLYSDSSISGNVYFITDKGLVVGGFLSKSTNENEKLLQMKLLFEIPDYNCQNTYASLALISRFRVLILRSKRFESEEKFTTDVLIINRKFDNEVECWNYENTFTLNNDQLDSKQDSYMYLFNTGHSSKDKITFLIGSIFTSKNNSDSKCNFFAALYWLTLNLQSEEWKLIHCRNVLDNKLKFNWPKYTAIYCTNQLEFNLVIVGEGRMNDEKDDPTDSNNQKNIVQNDEEYKNYNFDYEECDLNDLINLEMRIISGNDGTLLQTYDLTSHQWICSLSTNNQSASIALRHDVDVFIFELQQNDQLKHIDVIDAFGYIQASKTKKRFISIGKDFSKNWSHAIIADSERNLYIYWKTKEQRQSLKFGNQTIVTLDGNNNCNQGLYSTVIDNENFIYILTNDNLNLIRFKDETD